MSRFEFIDTPLVNLKVIQRKPVGDNRGFLSRLYCSQELTAVGLDKPVYQVNHTLTRLKGTVRGLHYQNQPYLEAKLITCLKGEIFDVAVDLRKNSPTFLKWHSVVLSEDNFRSLLIPEGFAHGFQTLSDDCELIYLHTAPYVKESEAALNVNDPKLGIEWPLKITELSDRDRTHPLITNDFKGIDV